MKRKVCIQMKKAKLRRCPFCRKPVRIIGKGKQYFIRCECTDNICYLDGFKEHEIDDINFYAEAYKMGDLKELNKKWKDKPMPDYLKKAYEKNSHIVVIKN